MTKAKAKHLLASPWAIVIVIAIIALVQYQVYSNKTEDANAHKLDRQCVINLVNDNHQSLLDFLTAADKVSTTVSELQASGVPMNDPRMVAAKTEYQASLKAFKQELGPVVGCPN